MALALALIALGLLSAPVVVRRRGRRLPPHRWARLLTVCMIGGAVLWEVSLLGMGLPTVLRAMPAGALRDACIHLLDDLQPVRSPVVGWLATSAASWSAWKAWRASRQIRRSHQAAHVEPWLGDHSDRGAYEVVTVPCDGSVAMSVQGTPPQIVLSKDLVESLSAAHLDVVLRHEAAHLDHRHDRYLRAVATVRGGLAYLPMASATAVLLNVALERWADEEAAGAEDRTLVRDALLAVTTTVVREGVAAFAGAATILERLAALAGPRPRSRFSSTLVVAAPAALLLGLAGAVVGTGRGEIRLLLVVIGICGG